MKTLRIFTRLIIFGLLTQCGFSESDARKGRVQRQAYLPPSSKNIIREEIITIHEEHPGSHKQFDESNYGGGKYQIFEVHNHYEPPSIPNAVHQSDYNAPEYLPPHQEIRVHHIHQAPGTNVNHLDISSPSSQPAVPTTFPSNHQQSIQGTSSHINAGPAEKVIRVEHFHISQLNTAANGAVTTNYLPPNDQHQSSFQQAYNAPSRYTEAHAVSQQQHQQQQHITVGHQAVSQQNHQQNQQSGQFKTPDYLPPHQGEQHVHHNVGQHQVQVQQPDQFKGPDYLPPYQNEQHFEHNHNNVNNQVQQQNQFKGPDYLPPHHTQTALQHNEQIGHHEQHSIQQQHQFSGPDYLPPHKNEQHHEHNNVNNQVQQQQKYKGPDYLPPHHIQTTFRHNEHQITQIPHQEQHSLQQQHQFSGPDYLPPHQNEQLQSQFKGPDYLPPHQSEQQHLHHQAQQPSQFKGPDYLPPLQGEQHSHNHEAQQHIHQQTQFQGPDYLPPHNSQQQNFQQPQVTHFQFPQTQSTAHNGHQQVVQTAEYKAPEYLPPIHSSNQPGVLPEGYDFSKPEEQSISQQSQPQPHFQSTLSQSPQAPLPAPTQLPPGYDFEKPPNAEAAIAELHTLPKEDDQEFVVQSQIQVGQNEQQAQVVYGQQQSSINYEANGYLPPHAQTQQSNIQTITTNLNQVAPQIFSPAPATTDAQPQGAYNLPPARPVQAEQYSSNLHSLSSYMNNVQPNVRYGVTQFSAPRQPFREYGPPPSNTAVIGNTGSQQSQQQQQPVILPVAPMYNSQASRSPYYAPAMSYATNAFSTSHTSNTGVHHHQHQHQQQQSAGYQYHHQQHHATFNQQTQLNLQQFMPQDIRQSNPNSIATTTSNVVGPAAAVPLRQPISSRVRTVQILNPSATKTLKVLETSDHAGVKTIKILGPSQSQPSGEHRIIKVITQNSNSPHEHVQTVKIFNDRNDAPIGEHNAYLPPVARTVRQSSSQQKKRHPLTRRHRYRF